MPSEHSSKASKRKLAAILFADIVGYTAMMQADEGNAMSRLRHYQEVLSTQVKQYDGQIIKNYGDGSLCVFTSVLDAVNCAKAIQDSLSQEPKVPLRIGLHLGDIMYEGDDIYGDALNVASRIESMGVAGAVLLSHDIYKKVKNQADLQFQSLSSFEFKNVEEPMEIYALSNAGMTIPRADEMKGKISETSNSNWPKVLMGLGILAIMAFSYLYFNGDNSSNSGASIAVLPFADMSPQQDQEYFSDGLSEELLNVLAKVKDMKVAGRTSSFKYKGVNDDVKKIGAELGVDHILEGSVRKAGNNIRVTAQLIKVEDGFHLWTETYDRTYSVENIFNIQDEISSEVLKVLKVKLLGVSSETKKVTTQNTEAYEAYLKGIQLSRNFQPKEIEKAIEHFKNAITLDPKFSLAYSHLALAYNSLVLHGNLNREEAFSAVKNNADKAILLDGSSGMANLALAYSFAYQRERDKRDEAGKKAYALEPNNPTILIWYATRVLNSDSAALKTELLEKAYSIDPLSPAVIESLSWNYLSNENYLKAQEFAEKNVAINPDYVSAHRNLVRLLRGAPYGRLDEAFIKGYKAYKQFPENIEVLRELSYMAIDLHLYTIADDVVEKMTQLYPENYLITSVKRENYFHQNDLTNYVKNIQESLTSLNVKQGEHNWISRGIETFYYSGKTEEAINYLKTYHPIYLSDTISSIPNDNQRNLAVVAAMLKHSGDLVQANRLTSIYCDYVTSEFEHNGDLKKEKRNLLRDYRNCASLSGDAKLAAEIGEEIYFNRKHKINAYDVQLNNIVSDLISDAPEFKALDARITTDINMMRDNAITFLKAEGVWIEAVKD